MALPWPKTFMALSWPKMFMALQWPKIIMALPWQKSNYGPPMAKNTYALFKMKRGNKQNFLKIQATTTKVMPRSASLTLCSRLKNKPPFRWLIVAEYLAHLSRYHCKVLEAIKSTRLYSFRGLKMQTS